MISWHDYSVGIALLVGNVDSTESTCLLTSGRLRSSPMHIGRGGRRATL